MRKILSAFKSKIVNGMNTRRIIFLLLYRIAVEIVTPVTGMDGNCLFKHGTRFLINGKNSSEITEIETLESNRAKVEIPNNCIFISGRYAKPGEELV